MSDPKIIAELNRIANKHGGILRPADLVEAAKPESSPLHSNFEWDDSEAAKQYRLWQARRLIAVTVEYIGSGEEAKLTRVFVSLSTDRGNYGGYRSIQSVMADSSQRKQLIEDAMQEMERFQAKYAELKELVDVFRAMREMTSRQKVGVA